MDDVCGGNSEGEGLKRVTGCIRLARLGVKSLCKTPVLLETGVATGSWFVCATLNWLSSVVPPCGTCSGDICGADNN